MACAASAAPAIQRRGSKGIHGRERWQELRPVISRLHQEGKTLPEIQAYLRSSWGFKASSKMLKARFSAWELRKNLTVPLLRRLLLYRVVNYGKRRRCRFFLGDKPIDVEAQLRRRNVPSVYELDNKSDLSELQELPPLPPSIRVVYPDDLPLSKSFSPQGITAEKEKIMKLLRNVTLHSHEHDKRVADPWVLTRGRAGTGFVNRFKDCGRNFQNGLGPFMLGAAIDELAAQLREPTRLGILHTIRLVFGGSRWKDFGVTAMIWRTMVMQTTERLHPGHPLVCICEALYELLGFKGQQTFQELMAACAYDVVEDMEKFYGEDHPYVLEAWLYVVRYCGVDRERLRRLLPIVDVKLREVGAGSSQDAAVREYLCDLATALQLPPEQCECYVDSYLEAVQARADRTNKLQRQSGVTLALAHHRVWDLKMSRGADTDSGHHLEKAIEFLWGALSREWTAGIKSRGRVVSWIAILENWLRESGNTEGAEAVAIRRQHIVNLAPLGKQIKFTPLKGPNSI